MSLSFTTTRPERQAQYSNLASNPSFETASGSVEVRRNMHPNPKFAAGGSVGVTQANTTVTLDTYLGRSMLKSVCTNVGASATRLHPNDKSIAAVQGQTVYSRVTVWNAAATSRSYQSTFRSSSSAPGSGTFTQLSLYNTTTQVIPAGGSYTFEHSATITDATAASVIMSVTRTSASGQVGDTFYCEDVYFSNTTRLPVNEPVLTGDSATTGDFSTVWAGVARQSDTIVTAPAISVMSTTNTGQRKAWQTGEQSVFGSKSMRNELVTASSASLQVINTVTSLSTGDPATLVFWARPRDRSITANPQIRGTTGDVQTFPVGVWTEVRLTVAAGSSSDASTGLLLSPTSGHQIGDVIDFDGVMLVPLTSLSQPYTGGYKDGNSEGWIWSGPTNNSTSNTTPTVTSQASQEIIPGWSITEEVTPVAVGDTVGAVASATITLPQGEDSEFLIDESVILDHSYMGQFTGRVSSANSNGAEDTGTDIGLSIIGPGGSLTAERDGQLVNGLRTILPAGQLRQGGSNGSAPGHISAKPGGLYRLDQNSGVVVIYIDREGNRTEVRLTGSTIPATTSSITGFDVTNDSYVIKFSGGKLGFYNKTTGALITAVGSAGSGTGQFGGGGSDTVYWNQANNIIYVADTFNNRVQRYTTLGAYIDSFPANGPLIVVGTASFLYIYGSANLQRISEYTLAGSPTGKNIPTEGILTAMSISPDTGGIVTVTNSPRFIAGPVMVNLYSISLATLVASYQFEPPEETEAARNLAPNPQSAVSSGTVPDFTNTAAATATRFNNTSFPGFVTRFTRTSALASRQGFEIPGLVTGETYTVSLKISSSVDATLNFQYRPNLDTNTDVVPIATVSLLAGVVTDLTYTFTTLSSSGVSNPGIAFISPSSLPIGATLDVARMIVVTGSTAVPYFSGGTAASGGYVYRWTGAENASQSVKIQQSAGHGLGNAMYISSNVDFTYVYGSGVNVSPWDYKVKLLAIGQATLYTAFAYYGALGGIDEIIYRHPTSTYLPLPGWTDTPWNKIKELAAAYNVEVAFEDSIYTVRSIGTRVFDLENVEGGSVSLGISTQQTAQTFDITYRQFEASTSGTFYNAAEEGNMISFSPNSTPTFVTLNSDANQLASVYQPYQVNSAATARDTPGTFYISDTNGIRVTAAMFEEVGGSVSVVLDSPTSVTVAISLGDPIPETNGSYKFGFGGSPRFSLSGAGIFGKPKKLTLYTGADPANTPPLKGADVTNIFINNSTMAYGRGSWRSEQLAGPQIELSATVPTAALDGFGVTAGSLVYFKESIYRVNSISIGYGFSSIKATRYVKQSDTQLIHAGFTMGQVDDFWAGTKYKDQIIKPLKWLVTTEPIDAEGYGHGPYGHSPYGHAS